ncbi:MAG: hypothetical protein KA792_05070, partial [Bacteroidales bacterium]|nr:hypothetical protein [Bacteroidales bacterium]
TSIISSNTLIAPRFINSELIGNYQADYLPLGTKKYNISGERCLLTGDAACLTDPFTGEGVANAMFSGRWAAEHIKNCFKTNDFSATFNKNYDNLIYNKIWKELKLSSVMQALAKNKTLLNYVIRKANKNQGVKEILNSMLSDMEIKKQLSKPSFYFKLLFK